MKNLVRTAAILSGVLALSGVGAALSVGCGGDDTVIGYGPDSGGDGPTVDSTADTFVPTDGGTDAFSFDAGPPSLSNFYHQINLVGCAYFQNCCGGAALFDLNACVADDDNPQSDGFLFTRTLETVPDGGHVTFDDTKASQCLSLIQGLSCSTASTAITSAQLLAIRSACYGAISGTIPAGSSGCTESIECVSPAHCEPFGGGTCVAPYDAGAPCAIGADTQVDSLNRCGRAYTGDPGYCELGPFTTVAEAGTCDTPHVLGGPCYSPFECDSFICDNTDDPGSCANTEAIINPGLCAAYPRTQVTAADFFSPFRCAHAAKAFALRRVALCRTHRARCDGVRLRQARARSCSRSERRFRLVFRSARRCA